MTNLISEAIVEPSTIKERYLRQAISVALGSPSEFKVGAILIAKKKVISSSCNYDRKTHPIQRKWAAKAERSYGDDLGKKTFLHAEIGALIKARREADTIVICRVGGLSGRELLNARPCRICSGFLIESGVFNIHYSTRGGFVYERWG